MSDQRAYRETLADLCYMAGKYNYYNGNRIQDRENLMQWAEEFEIRYKGIFWGVDLEFNDTLAEFFKEKTGIDATAL